jgi:adenine phosphoribosyltransferase
MNLLDYLPSVPDFPKPGIVFKDISPLLANHKAFTYAIEQLHQLSLFCQYDYILGIESRGLIFATALAQASKTGLVLARKPNKLPMATYRESYGLEYGSDALEIQQHIIPANARVLIVDDILATGGTVLAAANLVRKAGAQVSGALVLLEISELLGKAKLSERSVQGKALIQI